MGNEDWEKVLLQWVNCLKLINPITNVETLRNGEFICRLLNLLAPNTDIFQENISENLTNLIHSHYPNYGLDINDDILQTTSYDDFVLICSLLMHYCCMVEQNELLIKPLCDILSSKIQLSIRTFLEHTDTNVTISQLKNTINESVKCDSVISHVNIGDSPFTCQSPLQDFLKTPNSRKNRVERERELKKLRSELELEKCEKVDLMEENTEQKEKIRKLGNQMKEKCHEISKLRSELYAMESKTPPHTRKFAVNDLERHLRSEIENLEHYITQLRSEQDELQADNDKLVEKLKISGDILKTWQEKALTLESNYDELNEKYLCGNKELILLKAQCTELSALLDEHRAVQKAKEIENSANENKHLKLLETTEDLAHSVVEVQLKDALNENYNLRELLQCSVQEGHDLENELSTVRCRYEDLGDNFKKLQYNYDDLLLKVDELTSSQTALNAIKVQLHEKVCELTNDNEEKDVNISSLKSKLTDISSLYNECQSMNVNLKLELECKQNDFAIKDNQLVESIKQYETLKTESDIIQMKYVNSVAAYNEKVFALESLRTKYDELDANISTSLEKLEMCIYNKKRNNAVDNKFSAFDDLILQIETNNEHEKKEKSNLQNAVLKYEEQITDLQKIILDLNEREKISLLEKQSLQEKLKCADNNLNNLQEIIENNKTKITSLSNTISELNGSIEELGKLKDVIIDRDLKINELESIVDTKNGEINERITEETKMNGLIHALETKITNNNNEIKVCRDNYATLDLKFSNVTEELNEVKETEKQLRRENLQKEKDYLEKTHLLGMQIEEYVEKISRLEIELSASRNEYELKTFELMDLEKTKTQVESDFEATKTDLIKKNDLIMETMKKLDIEYVVIVKEKENLQVNLNDISAKYTKILEDKENMTEEIDALKVRLKSNIEKIRNAEEECSQKDTVISENNKALLNLKLELETEKRTYDMLHAFVDQLNIQANSYTFCIETLKKQNAEYDEKITELNNELNVLNNLKCGVETKNVELQKNMETIIVNMSSKNEELNGAIVNLTECKKKSEDNIKNLNILLDEAYKNVDILKSEKLSIVSKYDQEIIVLKNEITELNKEIIEHNEKEYDFVHELQATKDEMNDIFNKYTQNLQLQQELKSDNELQVNSLTESLHEVVEKYNNFNKSYQEVTIQLEENRKEVEAIKNEKITLEVNIIDQRKKYEQEIELTNEQFISDIKNLNYKQTKFESALEKANADLKLQRGIQYRLENDVKRLEMKITDVENEKKDLLEKIEQLERNRLKLETDYKMLQCSNEKYIEDGENKLREVENSLSAEINELQLQREDLKKNISILQNAVDSLKSEDTKSQKLHDDTVKENEKFVTDLQEKIMTYESNISKITTEQNSLQKQITLEKENYAKLNSEYENFKENNKEMVAEYQNTISKLKCAFDILQTGKEKLEIQYQNLQETNNRMEQEQNFNNIQLNQKLKLNEQEIANLQEKINANIKELAEKDEEIVNTVGELNKVKLIKEALSNEMKSLEDELKKTEEYNQMQLMKIEEENLIKITEMSNNFDILKTVYDEICTEHTNLKKEEEILKIELQNILEEKIRLENIISNNNLTMEDYKNQISGKDSTINHLEKVISDLKDTLHLKLSEFELIRKENNILEYRLEQAVRELESVKKSREDLLESQEKVIKETENNIMRVHANAIDAKNDLMKQIKEAERETIKERNLRQQSQELIKKEIEAKEFLETRILVLMNEHTKYNHLYAILSTSITKINELIQGKPINNCLTFDDTEESDLNLIALEIEERVVEIYNKNRSLSVLITQLENDKMFIENKLQCLENEKVQLDIEKENLLVDFRVICDEKKILAEEYLEIKNNCEKHLNAVKEIDLIKMENGDLQNAMIKLKDKNVKISTDYQRFVEESKEYKNVIDKLLKERNSLEMAINELGEHLHNIQMRYLHVNQQPFNKQQIEQKEVIEIVTQDIQKQFSRYSKLAYNLNSSYIQIYEKVVNGILSNTQINWSTLLKDLCIVEVSSKIEELNDRASDALEQCKSLEMKVENLENKPVKVLQENVMKLSTGALKTDAKNQEDEWRKKYNLLKQKLILTENVKNNYEKKVKQLRQENKTLSVDSKHTENESHYKILLQQHIQTKEEHEKIINETNIRYQKLQSEYESYKKQRVPEVNEGGSYEKIAKLEKELHTVREAYGYLMSDNSKFELDNVTLRKLLNERNTQLNELSLIKEAYENLLENNNKLMTEVDTLKYKRTRDKEEFLRIRKKEKEEITGRESKQIQDVRTEYEEKLEKMKEKMIKLYKDEVDKEIKKLVAEKSDNSVLIHTLEQYKRELDEAKEKIKKLEYIERMNDTSNSVRSMPTMNSECDLRDSVRNRRDNSDKRTLMKRSSDQSLVKGRDSSLQRHHVEDRRYSTMPRNMGMDIIEEVQIQRRTSVHSVPSNMGQNLEMEDEEELFNTKYLTDLQEGHCVVPSGKESALSRMSELAWRNSLCPPHLKSSYPAETQFATPTQFKEDEIKAGNVDFDDSMSTRLLPGEKPRKKDIGTTSYKKPGPPTPSKNGGRLSLQGNEIHPRDLLRDHNDTKTPKRTTPNRLKALFMGRSTVRDSENQPVSPRSKRLSSIFRKAR